MAPRSSLRPDPAAISGRSVLLSRQPNPDPGEWRSSMRAPRQALVFGLLLSLSSHSAFAQQRECGTAITGATLIDGNGGPAVTDAIVLVTGKKIEAVGPRAQVKVPACAKVIDATGKFLT